MIRGGVMDKGGEGHDFKDKAMYIRGRMCNITGSGLYISGCGLDIS